MRPDRIIVGEVRGAEAMDMLQAMNTGHEGSLSTIHANDTADALGRLEMMVAMTGFDLPVHVVRQYIATAIKLIVYVARLRGGQRRVTRISEVIAVENGAFRLADIFVFQQEGVDAAGDAFGHFAVTGYRPGCLQRMHEAGVGLPENMFAARRSCDPPPTAQTPPVGNPPSHAPPAPSPAPPITPVATAPLPELDLSSGQIMIGPPRPSGALRLRQQ
jgi:pilus assembly protein CpaF